MSFFKFYFLWFVSFIVGALLIGLFEGRLASETMRNIIITYVSLFLIVFLAKVIHSLTKNFFGLSDSFLISIKNFSFKRFLSFLLVIVPFVLIFVVAPIVLINYIGGWTFLVIPLLAIAVYIGIEMSAKQRENMPMLEHTEAIGVMMFIAYPTIISFILALIYYFW